MKFLYPALAFIVIVLSAFFAINYMKKSTKVFVPSPSNSKPNNPLQIKGSIPYWDQENAFLSVQKNPASLNYINLFWYYLGADGDIKKYQYAKEDKKIISFAHENNIKVFAVLTNLPEKEDSSWDSKRVEKILNDSNLREKHIRDILVKLEEVDFDGVIIDYEEVNSSQKNKFSDFIKQLSFYLNSKGKLVAVALHPKKTPQDEKNGIGAFQDLKALAQSANHINIMAYGEHYDESEPGPIASIPWLREIIGYLKSLKIPPEKIYLGIPLYGYNWTKDHDEPAVGLTYIDVFNLAKKQSVNVSWDEKSKSPYFTYEEDGDNHEVWFENARSVSEKIKLAKEAGLAGITFWRFGGEDPAIWNKIQEFKK